MNRIVKIGSKLAIQELIRSNKPAAHRLVRSVLPTWDIRVGNHLASKVGTTLRSDPSSNEHPVLLNAAVIYLSRSRRDDLNQLRQSIVSLKKYFLNRYPYPVIIFHEDISLAEQDKLRQLAPRLISFEALTFTAPVSLTENDIRQMPWRIGYCHMCNFFSGALFDHPRIRQLDWYMRLDVDSYILTPLPYDPFALLSHHGKSYGYLTTFYEEPSVCDSLAQFTSAFVARHSINPTFLRRFLDNNGQWNRTSFYTNFEVSSLSFWRSESFKLLWSSIKSSDRVYTHRWGDAPLHFIALSLFEPEERIARLDQIGYRHVNYYSVP